MIRPFTMDEERALLQLLAGSARWHPVPKKAGPLVWNKLTDLGCVQQLREGPVTKAKLTPTGRYFARLLAGVREPRSEMVTISGAPQIVLQLDQLDA